MTAILPVLLRKALPAACLVALTTVLAGCGPENSEPILPYMHNASLGGGGQLVPTPSTELRHRQHLMHLSRVPHHTPHS